MKFNARVFVCALAAALCSGSATASVIRKAPQSKPGDYAAMHAEQQLGRVIVSADGRYIFSEWGKPYLNWVPDVDWMAPNAANRLETFLYIVDLTAEKPTSEWLFYPNAGATYWLGDPSPDLTRVAVYELSHDNETVRAGVWSFATRKAKWFALRADESRLDTVTAWISNDEFLFPVKSPDARLARGNAATGEAILCPACSVETIKNATAKVRSAEARGRSAASKIAAPDLPKGAKLIAGAENGELAVYLKDDAQVLSLMYKRPEQPLQVLFDNKRRWVPFDGHPPEKTPPAKPAN